MSRIQSARSHRCPSLGLLRLSVSERAHSSRILRTLWAISLCALWCASGAGCEDSPPASSVMRGGTQAPTISGGHASEAPIDMGDDVERGQRVGGEVGSGGQEPTAGSLAEGGQMPVTLDPLPSEPIPPPSSAIWIQPEPQRMGDPEIGYDRFINAPFVGCGIPTSVFERVDVDRFFPLVGLPRERAFLEGRTGENASLPYFLTHNTNDEGVDVAGINCMSCHASVFQGELVVGLGNTTISTTSDVSFFANGIGGLVDDPAERRAWAYWAERMSAVGPITVLDTVGVVAADNLAVVLFGRRDPVSLVWQEGLQIELPPEGIPTVPLAVAPLWRMGKKNAMFYTGSFRGDHSRYMFAASSLCLKDLDEFHEIDSYFNHVRAWIASLEPPVWPYDLDEEKINRGREVFNIVCSGCHGEYGATRDEESYPNLVIPLEEIGTDPLLLTFEERFVEALGPWFAQTLMVESNYLTQNGGYMAPPLDGIWITAPYLHNDSVPSLQALLNSSTRPTYWRRASQDSADFDTDRVGWRVIELDEGKEAGAPVEVYDTTRVGYHNTGHLYGDRLTDLQRLDLIEYLKTL